MIHTNIINCSSVYCIVSGADPDSSNDSANTSQIFTFILNPNLQQNVSIMRFPYLQMDINQLSFHCISRLLAKIMASILMAHTHQNNMMDQYLVMKFHLWKCQRLRYPSHKRLIPTAEQIYKSTTGFRILWH